MKASKSQKFKNKRKKEGKKERRKATGVDANDILYVGVYSTFNLYTLHNMHYIPLYSQYALLTMPTL